MKIHGTAKGGALSKKDFGVAFGGGAAFSPEDISDLYAWYDMSEVATITKDSGTNRVSKVENKEGTTARDLLQSTGDDQPLWVSADRNGLDVVDFDDDRWLQTASALTEIDQPVTIFIVLETPAGDASQKWWYNTHSDVSQNFATYSNEGGADVTAVIVDNQLTVSFAAGAGVWQYVTTQFNTTATKLRMNGVEKLSGDAGTDGFSGYILGAYNESPDQPIDTPIGEVIIYNKLVSGSELTSMETYLKDKWGF